MEIEEMAKKAKTAIQAAQNRGIKDSTGLGWVVAIALGDGTTKRKRRWWKKPANVENK